MFLLYLYPTHSYTKNREMKKCILLLTVCFCIGFLNSCEKEKCLTCVYELGGQTTTSAEICGSSSDLDDAEAEVQAQADAAAQLLGQNTIVINCSRK